MAPQSPEKTDQNTIYQPLTPEEVGSDQAAAHSELPQAENANINLGDRIDESKSLLEKAQQVAVDVADITGEQVVVPTYFVTNEPDGEHRALHHVRDAEAISDVIRQARVDEEGNRHWW
ncbi:MAG: hypothetical protein HC838_04980 [Spirulinaceae cyanobacterium RM2_2_10]|nr:hypothetical protein [Spirulinaceae cyanobacterium SM2_1_0]NJO19531.1 hypothetical protein [Spirulinaceae cyanobacterium RM2_2_10]